MPVYIAYNSHNIWSSVLTHCVIVKVIDDYDIIYDVINYDYIAYGNGNYDYLKSYNRLQSIRITDYNYPNLNS